MKSSQTRKQDADLLAKAMLEIIMDNAFLVRNIRNSNNAVVMILTNQQVQLLEDYGLIFEELLDDSKQISEYIKPSVKPIESAIAKFGRDRKQKTIKECPPDRHAAEYFSVRPNHEAPDILEEFLAQKSL